MLRWSYFSASEKESTQYCGDEYTLFMWPWLILGHTLCWCSDNSWVKWPAWIWDSLAALCTLYIYHHKPEDVASVSFAFTVNSSLSLVKINKLDVRRPKCLRIYLEVTFLLKHSRDAYSVYVFLFQGFWDKVSQCNPGWALRLALNTLYSLGWLETLHPPVSISQMLEQQAWMSQSFFF